MAGGADDLVQGMNAFSEQAGDVQKFMKALADTKFDVHFDPRDEASVDRAASEIERAIDEIANRFPGNASIARIAREAKEHQVHQLRQHARRNRHLW